MERQRKLMIRKKVVKKLPLAETPVHVRNTTGGDFVKRLTEYFSTLSTHGWEDIEVQTGEERGYVGEILCLSMRATRLETTEEAELREAREERLRTHTREREYKEWQRLNEKYGTAEE